MKKNLKENKKIDHLFKRRLYIYLSNIKLWSRWIVLLMVILLIYQNTSNMYSYFKTIFIETSADLGFKLNNIVIEGQKNLDVKDVISRFNADNNTPIFLINLAETRKILKQNDWVKEAIVIRKLPNTIHIKIVEREPIALWQQNKELFLVDEEGLAIKGDIDNFSHLLHFVGDGANVYAASLIRAFLDKPELFSNIRSVVRFGNRRWNFILKNGIVIKMPEQNFETAMDYLNRQHLAGKLLASNIKVLDLRDNEKYYVEKE
jgi:cell division protein FtsQ